MLTTRITLDTKQFTQSLTALQQRQLPFAASLAINRMGEAFQKAERERLARVFTLRRPDFILREGVKRIGPAASKQNPSVVFGVSERADFLERFEEGTRKTPTQGAGHSLAVPHQARRNKKDIITAAQRPRTLLRQGKTLKKAGGRVFILREKRGRIGPGIFQTTGRKGQGGVKLLFSLVPSVPTAKSLEFLDTAKAITSQWPSIFDDSLAFALRTAR